MPSKPKKLTAESARATALGLLGRREHSARELTVKLRERGYLDNIVSEVISTLAAEDLQSDERFAESYVYSRVTRGSGPLRIQAELLVRGLSDDIIEAAMDEYKMVWEENAYKAYIKRYIDEPLNGSLEVEAKRQRFLKTRGYTTEQIRSAIERAEGKR